MLAVIFELEPIAKSKQQYLEIAAALGTELNKIDGFISIERFESLSQPGKLLSLSFWRDEAAISAWRNLEQHRGAAAGCQCSARLQFAATRNRACR